MESLLVGALTASKIYYRRRPLMRAGVILLVIGLPVWAGLLPPPLKWLDMMHSVMADERASFLYLFNSLYLLEDAHRFHGKLLASNCRWPARSRGSEFSHDGLTSLSDHLRSSALN
jgi:hypothetical protein